MTSKNWITYLVILLVGLGIGYFIPKGRSGETAGMNAMESSGGNSAGMQDSGHYNVPAGTPVPTVSVEALRDSEMGWNLHITTTNFTFAPQHAGGDNVPGEGHAHVLVDGKMVTRAYGPWVYLGTLPNGQHTVSVELETNDHMDYYAGGKQIMASTTIGEDANMAANAPQKTFTLNVQNGKVVSGPKLIAVNQGDMVTMNITLDMAAEIHLHGYNKMLELQPGKQGTISFLADTAGNFPFEIEDTKTDLGAVQVMPK